MVSYFVMSDANHASINLVIFVDLVIFVEFLIVYSSNPDFSYFAMF